MFRVYMGIMENKMETTGIIGVIIRVLLGFLGLSGLGFRE